MNTKSAGRFQTIKLAEAAKKSSIMPRKWQKMVASKKCYFRARFELTELPVASDSLRREQTSFK